MLMRSPVFWPEKAIALWFVFLFWVQVNISNAQQTADSFTLTAEHPGITGFIAEDALGNKYALSDGGIQKIGQGNQKLLYSNRQLGNITHADVTDPLNILVFFGEAGHYALLDNHLTVKNIVEASGFMGGERPAAVCSAPGKGYWLWIPDIFRVIRFDFRDQPQLSGNDLSISGLFPDIVFHMVFHNDHLFLGAQNGIWIFDQFANLIKHIPINAGPFFQVKGNKIFYAVDNRLMAYDFFLEKENVFLLPDTKIKGFFLKNETTIYLQTEHSLKKYSFAGKFF